METEVAPAGLPDIDQLAALINSAYRGPESRVGWTTEADFLDGQRTDSVTLLKCLETPGQVILCLREHGRKEILGCVFLEKVGDKDCYLGMLTVKPRLQAGGLGRVLMEHAENYARDEWHARSMVLGVIQLRESLIAWYERRGYRRNGKIKPFPYGDRHFGIPLRPDLHFVVFEKQLS